MEQKAREVAAKLRAASSVKIVTHIDADGITAGSIASVALTRAGIDHTIEFVRKLDPDAVERIKQEEPELVWFTDLGSGHLDQLNGLECVITDHHVPSSKGSLNRKRRMDILAYAEAGHDVPQVNPHLIGRNGATDVSGAGATYLAAKALDPGNTDLAALAVVGAVGDLQDTEARRLTGTNVSIVEDAVEAGVVERAMDIRFFGRETRPVYKILQYSSDPVLPGLTGREKECLAFISSMGVPLKEGEEWRTWNDLAPSERKQVISELGRYLLTNGMGWRSAIRLVGETYTLLKEARGSELRDAKEFATLLNSCGRHDKAEIGYRVCLGDRDEWLKRARQLLAGHRRSLVESLNYVKEVGVTRLEWLQWFHGADVIPETIVGTVAGMCLNSPDFDGDVPMFGFALTEDGSGVKVSARGNRPLIERGMDLSVVMREGSKAVGGVGGGHNVAAGATIPYEKEQAFLVEAGKILSRQLKAR